MDHLSPEEWAKWRNHPETLKFFKYIEDFRLQTGHTIAALISSGISVEDSVIQDAAKRCQIYIDICDLTHADIKEFYNPEKEEDNDPSGN
jgi:hypothetical protein